MKKVLIIDDENRTRDLIAKMIESFGFDVETIPEGESVESGINAIIKNKPDIVFLDIQMPGLLGTSFLSSLAIKPLVIFVTAYANYAVESYNLDAVD